MKREMQVKGSSSELAEMSRARAAAACALLSNGQHHLPRHALEQNQMHSVDGSDCVSELVVHANNVT